MANFIDFEKLTDDDFEQAGIPAEGDASWEIHSVEARTSKSSGKPTVKITFKVVDSAGKRKLLIEHLPMGVPFRVARIASVTDTTDMAKEGRINIEEWVGKTGKGNIKHEASPGFHTKAVWAYFLEKEATLSPAPAPAPSSQEGPPPIEADFNDDVPF